MVDLDELERLEREATPGPWKIAITKFASGDGWYVVDAHGDFIAGANAPKPSTDEPNTRCVAAARNALPDIIAELRALRARVAELERTTPSLEWIDLRPAHEPMREMLALSYEQGRRDALRGVQGACLYEVDRVTRSTVTSSVESIVALGAMEASAYRRIAKAAEEAAR